MLFTVQSVLYFDIFYDRQNCYEEPFAVGGIIAPVPVSCIRAYSYRTMHT